MKQVKQVKNHFLKSDNLQKEKKQKCSDPRQKHDKKEKRRQMCQLERGRENDKYH